MGITQSTTNISDLDWLSFLTTSIDDPNARLILAFASAIALGSIVSAVRSRSNTTTRLRGPPSESLIWGVAKKVPLTEHAAAQYTAWEAEYGPGAYRIPFTLGKEKIVLFDARAIAHFFAMDNTVYIKTAQSRSVLRNLAGEGILWAEGDVHRRQRKVLSPAFTNAAIRSLNPIFYDCAYKCKDTWDTLTKNGEALIEVQDWMNNISIDAIGLAGFSHDFNTLGGDRAGAVDAFDATGANAPASFTNMLPLLLLVFPWLDKLPSPNKKRMNQFNDALNDLSERVWKKLKDEGAGDVSEKSIVGRLLRAESSDTSLQLSKHEVIDEIKVMIIAGYITTSTSLTWALIELAKNPDAQARLRTEITQFSDEDPSYEDLVGDKLPYLDAVTHETLRLHPSVPELTRVAAVDDIIPLSAPVTDASGRTVDRISIAKGTLVGCPITAVNRSPAFWGADALEFRPGRWIEGVEKGSAKDLTGHRHLLTFASGPRTCIGKGFAIAEFKTVLAVLVRNFTFDIEGGKSHKVTITRGSSLPGRKIFGENGKFLALKVSRVA
ncbi:cytochrome P450 [Coniophora puteana RWD-64-598 SS2]|uniref:Cytochrome P450 n=1 Tax=Coniophora puteana (strain RWD-64-598) TaxID=741705 RepID=A0A5M3MTC6_CONPW|nr:cytochrome P450 [Coniophora puteana RWD-64-598 SS2]EIW81781.1 cytochrome P450 [Coniophora puteana RWD-64-598 SS2]